MPKFYGIVALERAQIIGFAFGLFQQWENEQHFYLKEMCVRATQQRGGVGTRLLRHLITQLKAAGVSQISLGTGRDTPAAGFYARLGFKTDQRTIIMNKRLTIARSSTGNRLRKRDS